jgi:hypothetical protein
MNSHLTRSNSVHGDKVRNPVKQNGTHRPFVSLSADTLEDLK